MDYIDVNSPPHNTQKIQFVKICANLWLKIPHPLIRGKEHTLIRGEKDSVGVRGG